MSPTPRLNRLQKWILGRTYEDRSISREEGVMTTRMFYGHRARHRVSPALVAKWPGTHTAIGSSNKGKRRPDVDYAQLMAIKVNCEWIRTKIQVDDILASHYLEVLPSHVPERRRARAQAVVEKVAASFGIPAPPIEWFSEEIDEERRARKECGECPFGGYFTWPEPILGMADKADGKIWIHAHLADENLTRVATHEVLHLAFPEAGEDQIKEYEANICSDS